MSFLKNLHKKLYEKDADFGQRLSKDEFNPENKEQGDIQMDRQMVYSKQNETGGDSKNFKKKILIGAGIGLGVLIILAAVLVFIDRRHQSAFSPDKVVLSIEGDNELKSGERVKYKVKIENANRASLGNAVLKINYSSELTPVSSFLIKETFNSSSFDLGTIKSEETKEVELEFDVFGAKDIETYLRASVLYTPSNVSSNFEAHGQKIAIIKASVLDIILVPTKEAASGEIVELQTIVQNNGQLPFDNLEMKAEYPSGFSFQESEVAPISENNIWKIDSLPPGEEYKNIIEGTLVGSAGEFKQFSVSVGEKRENEFIKYSLTEATTKISTSRIEIQRLINSSTEIKNYSANEKIECILKFKNTSDEPLSNLVITEVISSPVIDKSLFSVTSGYYDSASESIIWKAADVPALKSLNPNEEGEVKYSFKIKEKFPMESEGDKNFVVNAQANIESLDIDSPLGQNKKVYSEKLVSKVNSKLIFSLSGSYNDGELQNAGPFPPQAGQETTYTLRFNIMNTSNDLQDVVLQTGLFAGASWKNNFQPEVSGLEFNDRSNELKWNMGTIQAGTGFLTPVKTLAFQLGYTPSESDMEHVYNVVLLNPVKITALDSFTGERLEFNFNEFKIGSLTDY